MTNPWRSEPPAESTVAWVWYINGWVLARWDGRNWIDCEYRHVLVGVTHWLPQEASTG